MNKILIIFAKKPKLGKVKTRLAKSIGTKKALDIYIQLLDYTIEQSKHVNATTKIYWFGNNGFSTENIQTGNDLGERMYNALSNEIMQNKVCLVGTDTPFLTSAIIEMAFNALEKFDMVFGPSKDGGYYLVASKVSIPKDLFFDKSWSHSMVLKDALKVCDKLNLSVKLMPPLLDIDTVKDYNEWKNTKV